MVIVVCSIFVGFFINAELIAQGLLRETNFRQSKSENWCFERVTLFHIGELLVFVWIPLSKILPFPHSLTLKLTIFMKFNIGFFFALVSIVGYFLLDVIGHVKLGKSAINMTCLLEINVADYATPLNLDYRWAMIPYYLKDISIALMVTATMQFITAQSPYSMKGLIFGLAYGIMGISIAFNYLILLPITSTAHMWPPSGYGCGMWYLLSACIVLLVMFVLLLVLSCKYERRQRADVLPSEHIFAINYYSRYTMQNTIN